MAALLNFAVSSVHHSAGRYSDVDRERVVTCFSRYMEAQGERVTRAQFEQNLAEKRSDPVFTGDIGPLLAAGTTWDTDRAFESVLQEFVARLPGAPWRGGGAK